ncbi:signal peptidase I [Shewanella sp. 202IG2-18]|uniref:signal peptidase I n=1 Tax=Parashewanella hymeniacidonis TaxID=2807618 RepID=UPI001960C52A|nr:signal peptidase I [Parashewanella hymeniacidonis]MBM7072618.1 signal peptidase I [Parashewanella hymeniacidonis]
MAQYFSLILVIVTLVSGIIWAIDAFAFAPKRKAALAAAEKTKSLTEKAKEKILQESSIVETAHSIFPVIAFVLILRSFIYEPFQIPSGSMMPTLLVGDFILVEKYAYGLKDPVWRKQLVETGKPKRGDVVVFKYPIDPTVDYIKRVVGLPGDKIIYRNKQLYIQKACVEGVKECPGPELIHRKEINRGEFSQNGYPMLRYNEQLGDVNHDILINPAILDRVSAYYKQDGTKPYEFEVPKGKYFMMGDNRDNSLDSRFWGFVPEANLVGKAVAIWISFEFDRTDADFLPKWVPTGVRFNRVGGIH